MKGRGIELVGSLLGTNKEGTFPPGALPEKLYFRMKREMERERQRERIIT